MRRLHAVTLAPAAAVARGRAIHKILQDLPGMAPDAGLNFARRILTKNGLDAGLAEKILGLITHPDHSDFFGPDSQAEVSIGSISQNGQRITERIDRLVVRDNDILVLDYKTDWNVPDRLDGRPSPCPATRPLCPNLGPGL